MSSNPKSIVTLPQEFVILDLETTGLSCYHDKIIEICMLLVRDFEIVDKYHTLVHVPEEYLDDFIIDFTGITYDMLIGKPEIEDITDSIFNFIGDRVVVGHNVFFDISYLKRLRPSFDNYWLNTVRIFRKVYPELGYYNLGAVLNYLKIKIDNQHRAEDDCIALLEAMKKTYSLGLDIPVMFIRQRKKIDLSSIEAENTDDMDPENELFGKNCVFTGKLEMMERAEAAQLVANVGGHTLNTLTKKTDYLIVGDVDYCSNVKNGKTSKQKKAESYILNGIDISIIDEKTFYDLVGYRPILTDD